MNNKEIYKVLKQFGYSAGITLSQYKDIFVKDDIKIYSYYQENEFIVLIGDNERSYNWPKPKNARELIDRLFIIEPDLFVNDWLIQVINDRGAVIQILENRTLSQVHSYLDAIEGINSIRLLFKKFGFNFERVDGCMSLVD